MSIEKVREKIIEFLKSPEPEVLCIRGKWGTGKTYTWNRTLEDAAVANDIALRRYGYVSLFGLNSLSEIRLAIFQSSGSIERIGKPFNLADVKASTLSIISTAKKGIGIIRALWGADEFDAMLSVAAEFGRQQILCIDDLERKGENLRSADVLGFISQLRYERGSKVVLLLNDEQLEDKEAFQGFLEKVVDINIRYAPSPEEAANIAIPNDDRISALVRGKVKALYIDNIRVISKLHRLVKNIEPFLAQYKPEVLESVAGSLVLFGWSHYQPELAPPVDFIRKRNSPVRKPKGDITPQAEGWNQILQEYGYAYTDDFDLVLIQGVTDGYFQPKGFELHAHELDNRVAYDHAQAEYREAWHKYHYSFKTSAEEVMAILYASFMKNIEFLNLGNLGASVNLFHEMGNDKQADQMTERYFEVKKDIPGAFDVANLFESGRELSKELRARVESAYAAQRPKLDGARLFTTLAKHAYEQDYVLTLANTPVDEYVRVLTSYEGEELLNILRPLRDYGKVGNPSDTTKEINKRFESALAEIAKTSPFNARRTKTWLKPIEHESHLEEAEDEEVPSGQPSG